MIAALIRYIRHIKASVTSAVVIIAAHRLALDGHTLSDLAGVGPSGCSTQLYVKLPTGIFERLPAFSCILLHHVCKLAYMFAQWF